MTTGCSSKKAPAPEAQRDIEFFDAGSFDRNLSSALRAELPLVTVSFPAAITLNSIPKRMDVWLSKTEEYGGKVTLVPVEDNGKGILSEALSFMVAIYDYMKDVAIYSPVEGYDAFIYYQKGNGIVTKLTFEKQQEPQPEKQ